MKYKTHHQKETKEKAFEDRKLHVDYSKSKLTFFYKKRNLHFIKIFQVLLKNYVFDLPLKILKNLQNLKKLQILKLNKYFFIHCKISYILNNAKKYIKNIFKKTMTMIERKLIKIILNIKFKSLSLISNPKQILHLSNNYSHYDEYSNQSFTNQVIVKKLNFLKNTNNMINQKNKVKLWQV